ncbi:hypothetical protein [Pandoraea sputorum]|uniref:Uncharacterized protein n=1 Tax=Pandoraea sputorum TaxID=93222 RepID=A0A239SQT1_9BURK|nr:hypothetical protein [Pandoraea sputorum]AJC18026.1 hypothetical protein NA29_22455 [Pandoraea sputorum]SNU87104.1 Uncharacterised protein [Pandoraea sputorum]VVE24525.1 hypothetical protein PSP20601_03326 [Pandoraea sputorum]VVE78075.1 hypothetical protein PSP31120_01455 [Pandoraea sputorum]
MPSIAQRVSLEPPGANATPADASRALSATPAAARASLRSLSSAQSANSAVAATPASTLTTPGTPPAETVPVARQRNRYNPRARLDATLDITLSRAAVSSLAVTLAMSLPLPWRVETIRPIRRDTAAVVSIALPRVEAARAMDVVMQSLPEAEFGALRLRPAV